MFTPRKCSIPRIEQRANLQKLDHGDACAVAQFDAAMDALGWINEEAAAFLDVSTCTVWRWRNQLTPIPAGKLKAIVIEAQVPSLRAVPTAKAVGQ